MQRKGQHWEFLPDLLAQLHIHLLAHCHMDHMVYYHGIHGLKFRRYNENKLQTRSYRNVTRLACSEKLAHEQQSTTVDGGLGDTRCHTSVTISRVAPKKNPFFSGRRPLKRQNLSMFTLMNPVESDKKSCLMLLVESVRQAVSRPMDEAEEASLLTLAWRKT